MLNKSDKGDKEDKEDKGDKGDKGDKEDKGNNNCRERKMFIICARKMSLSIQFPCTFRGNP
ncbi:MAG: hypothetical protein F6J96_10615 [Symploca sp. SIO1C2]|nr:hypothetical protein [Symploca sp. SIO1C2]